MLFILDDGVPSIAEIVKLAPAYDLLNTTIALSGAAGRHEEMALPLRGKQRGITSNDLLSYYAKERLGLNENVIRDTLQCFREALPGWEPALVQSFLPVELRERYCELLQERRQRLEL